MFSLSHWFVSAPVGGTECLPCMTRLCLCRLFFRFMSKAGIDAVGGENSQRVQCGVEML